MERSAIAPILAAIQSRLDMGGVTIVSIDGRCGSGKTSLAKAVCEVFPCNIFHMDDYYLPMDQRKPSWERLPGGNMDFARFKREVLLPAARYEAVLYQPFDCRAGAPGKAKWMPPSILTLVEGSYSAHPELEKQYDLKIFLTCSKEVQRARLKQREKENFRTFEWRWIPMEENYLQTYDIEKDSTFVLDTSDLF